MLKIIQAVASEPSADIFNSIFSAWYVPKNIIKLLKSFHSINAEKKKIPTILGQSA